MTGFNKSGCRLIYKSKSGRETEVQDLNSAHLANILRKLERAAKVEFSFGNHGESCWRDLLPEAYQDLEDEALYRGLDWTDPDISSSEA